MDAKETKHIHNKSAFNHQQITIFMKSTGLLIY